MPKLPEQDATAKLATTLISGEEWNELIEYAERMTPRGDGVTTYAEVDRDGTQIKIIDDNSSKGDGGGANLGDLPPRTDHKGPALMNGQAWNKLLDYLASITPKADGENAFLVPDNQGQEISFPPFCPLDCPFDFSFEVTVTGGEYPFEWLGHTWYSSGQTCLVCGGGTQAQGQTTVGFYGLQNWNGTQGGTGSRFSFNNAYSDFIVYPLRDWNVFINVKKPGSFYMNVGWKQDALTATIYSPTFYLSFPSYYSFTYTFEITSSLTAFDPTAYELKTPSDNYLFSAMNGSLTTTAGRTVAWTASPSFPWDYPDPEE